jgi:hypothetical protein
MMDREAFYIGMDLGSFKTSVMASNGRRETIHTTVGWPKDHVARAMLGCEVVFGEQVLQKRLALDVIRPFAKGALKYLDDGQAAVTPEEVVRRQKAAVVGRAHGQSPQSSSGRDPVRCNWIALAPRCSTNR